MASREAQHPVQFDDLYREVVLEHYRRPRNKGPLDDATVVAEGLNPSCGDEIQVALKVEDGRLTAVHFGGQGCSISQSSASMLTEQSAGLSLEEVSALSRAVQAMVTDEGFDLDRVDLGDLEALQGVAKFPVRVKCALLAWKVLDLALAEARGETPTTDSDIPTRIASASRN